MAPIAWVMMLADSLVCYFTTSEKIQFLVVHQRYEFWMANLVIENIKFFFD